MIAITHSDQPAEEWRPGVRTRRIVAGCDGATTLCIFEQWVDPGVGAPTHAHEVEEILTVIAGQAEFWLGPERIQRTAGSSIVIPAGARHGFRNSGTTLLHLQAVLASPYFEADFGEGVGRICRWKDREP